MSDWKSYIKRTRAEELAGELFEAQKEITRLRERNEKLEAFAEEINAIQAVVSLLALAETRRSKIS